MGKTRQKDYRRWNIQASKKTAGMLASYDESQSSMDKQDAASSSKRKIKTDQDEILATSCVKEDISMSELLSAIQILTTKQDDTFSKVSIIERVMEETD